MKRFRRSQVHQNNAVKRNVASVADIQRVLNSRRTPGEALSDAITRFTGSINFIIAHVVFFAGWIALNSSGLLGAYTFDPYPFIFLNLTMSIEAVLLSTFILMSQNRQTRQAEQWAHLDLQVDLLGEQETTQMLKMLRAICGQMGIEDAGRDREIECMIQKTRIDEVMHELEKAHVAEEPAAEKAGPDKPITA